VDWLVSPPSPDKTGSKPGATSSTVSIEENGTLMSEMEDSETTKSSTTLTEVRTSTLQMVNCTSSPELKTMEETSSPLQNLPLQVNSLPPMVNSK